MNDRFWRGLDELVVAHTLKVDRPQGSAHPRYPAVIYPFDYGYLEGTQSGDGDGVDMWVGSLPEKRVMGIVCTVDADKRDVEVKLLLGCSPREAQDIVRFHNLGAQAAMWVRRITLPDPGQ